MPPKSSSKVPGAPKTVLDKIEHAVRQLADPTGVQTKGLSSYKQFFGMIRLFRRVMIQNAGAGAEIPRRASRRRLPRRASRRQLLSTRIVEDAASSTRAEATAHPNESTQVDITYRLRYDWAGKKIVITWYSSWTAKGSRKAAHVDAVSYFHLDDEGKVFKHEVDRVEVNGRPMNPP